MSSNRDEPAWFDPDTCVICYASLPEGYGGLCGKHRYDEQPECPVHGDDACWRNLSYRRARRVSGLD